MTITIDGIFYNCCLIMQPNIACWVNLPKRTYIQNYPFIVIVYLVPFLSLKTVLIILILWSKKPQIDLQFKLFCTVNKANRKIISLTKFLRYKSSCWEIRIKWFHDSIEMPFFHSSVIFCDIPKKIKYLEIQQVVF